MPTHRHSPRRWTPPKQAPASNSSVASKASTQYKSPKQEEPSKASTESSPKSDTGEGYAATFVGIETREGRTSDNNDHAVPTTGPVSTPVAVSIAISDPRVSVASSATSSVTQRMQASQASLADPVPTEGQAPNESQDSYGPLQ